MTYYVSGGTLNPTHSLTCTTLIIIVISSVLNRPVETSGEFPVLQLENSYLLIYSLRVRFNTGYLWIGLDVSCERPAWIGLSWVGSAKMDSCPTLRQTDFVAVHGRTKIASDSMSYYMETTMINCRREHDSPICGVPFKAYTISTLNLTVTLTLILTRYFVTTSSRGRISSSSSGWSKNWHIFVRLIISSNIDQFSNSFHCQNHEKICNSTVIKDPTTPQMCRYTTL